MQWCWAGGAGLAVVVAVLVRMAYIRKQVQWRYRSYVWRFDTDGADTGSSSGGWLAIARGPWGDYDADGVDYDYVDGNACNDAT